MGRWLIGDGEPVVRGPAARRGGDRQGDGRDRGAGRRRAADRRGRGRDRAGRGRPRRARAGAPTASPAAAPDPGREPVPAGAGAERGQADAPPAAIATAAPDRRTGRSPRRRTPARAGAGRRARGASRGTGPGGRIVPARPRRRRRAGAGGAATGADDARLRQAVVANITASWQQIPHVHIGGELDAAGLVEARARAGAGVTVTDLLVLALARALGEVPELNALRRPDGSSSAGDAVHLSLAVATTARRRRPGAARRGLARALAEVADERRRLVEAARAGTLEGRDLTGGTCTLSNLGAYPVDFFAPVVSGPQVAMVATGRVVERVVRRRRPDRRAPTDVGQRRHRPPRGRRRGGRPPPRGARAPDRASSRRARMTIAPVPVDEAVPGPRPARPRRRDAARALSRHDARPRLRGGGDRRLRGRARSPARRTRASGRRRSRPGRSRALRADDLVFATYRGHGEALLKGVDPVGDDGRADGPGDRRLQGEGRLDAPLRAVGRAGLDQRDRRRAHPDGRRRRALVPVPAHRSGRRSASSATAPRARASSSRR